MILTIDIGTTSMKGGVISPAGDLIAFKSIRFKDFFLTRDSHLWLKAFKSLCRKLSRGISLQGVSISGNGPSLVPLNDNDKPAFKVLFWKDQTHSVIPESRSYYLPKAQWLKNDNPAVYRKVKHFLAPAEYLSFLLTGEAWMVTPNDTFSPHVWNDEEVSLYGLDREKFPPLITMGEIMGRITKTGSSFSGLPENLPVYAAGSDFTTAILGTATVRPGLVCDRAGSSEGINLCLENSVSGEGLRPLPHAIEGLYNCASILFSTGALFDWYRDLTGQKKFSYDKSLKMIAKVPITSDSPHFFPKKIESGMYAFSENSFSSLKLSHDRWIMGKSVLEAIGFAVREGVDKLQKLEKDISTLRVSGGQCKNDIWNQMKSDLTGLTLEVPEIEDGELTGCAVTAYKGCGEFSTFSEAAENLVLIKKTFSPRKGHFDHFKEKYEEYRSLRDNPV